MSTSWPLIVTVDQRSERDVITGQLSFWRLAEPEFDQREHRIEGGRIAESDSPVNEPGDNIGTG